MPANLENSAVAIGLKKGSFHSNDKECSNYRTVALISHTIKVMASVWVSHISKGFNSMWTENFQMVKLDLEKGQEPEIKLP